MGTKFKGGKDVVRAMNAFIKLQRAANSVSARTRSGLEAAGLTESQFGILDALYHLGAMPQRDLSTKILKTGGNITMVVDNLEKSGLVQRRRDCPDRRLISVHLTPAGRRLIKKLMPSHAGRIAGVMGALSPRELDTLGALCKKLGLGDKGA